jgi:hypothetical protein
MAAEDTRRRLMPSRDKRAVALPINSRCLAESPAFAVANLRQASGCRKNPEISRSFLVISATDSLTHLPGWNRNGVDGYSLDAGLIPRYDDHGVDSSDHSLTPSDVYSIYLRPINSKR